MMDKKLKKQLLIAQRNEITEHHIYRKLSQCIKDANNREVLKRIADDELRHNNFWKQHTGTEIEPDRFKVWKYCFMARLLGLTFSIKLMEQGEKGAQENYSSMTDTIAEARQIADDENRHEQELIRLIDEERLKYVSSMILGLNDALVELTGALAGFTLALKNTRLIAMAGLITGIAASFSMAASEYLSTKSEKGDKNPLKSSVYTGTAYVCTVILLIFPFLVFPNVFFCLGFSLFNAVFIILIFTYYISVAQEIPFWKRFSEMALISLGIAALTFGIGYIIRIFFDIEV
jgi:VIT1/CCC1 family predicted Fe2+/Mn2+ transporter